MLQGLYQAPGSLLDYCDSSGCLPGQIPLKGVGRGGNFTPKTIESQMGKVRTYVAADRVSFRVSGGQLQWRILGPAVA